jgi:cytochrome P450
MYQLSLPESSEIQEKLCRELRHATATSVDDLPYLEAVVKEGLRCFPPIPMSQPRYVPVGGRRIDGYFIPEGTIVSCQAFSIHQLNEAVYSNGDQFIPERWLNPQKIAEMNRLFFAFGAGARGCTGRQ